MENNEDKDLEPQGGAVEQESSSPQQDHMTSSEKDDEMKSDSEENSATRGNSESNPSSPQEEITDQPNIPKPDDPHSPIVSHISSSNRSVRLDGRIRPSVTVQFGMVKRWTVHFGPDPFLKIFLFFLKIKSKCSDGSFNNRRYR